MKRASISETKNRLSELLERVRHGETVLITDRERILSDPAPRLKKGVSAVAALLDERKSGAVRCGRR
jgi:antitoxin (DNA-binding transcriptional repressor) of toxin-antitoxin stability system